MRKIVEGDWVEALGEVDRRKFHISGYVVKITEDEILVKTTKGKYKAVPKHWAKSLDVTVIEAGLKDLINLSLDIKDKHLFEMYMHDLRVLQSK